MLVIVPTFHEARERRKGQIVAGAAKGIGAMRDNKKVRPIFKGTARESEPPQPVGGRAPYTPIFILT